MTGEQLRRNDFTPGPDAGSDPFAPGDSVGAGRVEVIHGVYAHSLPLSGMTVGQARDELEDRMNIDPEAIAVVDGREAGDDTVLSKGQVLNFVKHSGEKGHPRSRLRGTGRSTLFVSIRARNRHQPTTLIAG